MPHVQILSSEHNILLRKPIINLLYRSTHLFRLLISVTKLISQNLLNILLGFLLYQVLILSLPGSVSLKIIRGLCSHLVS